MTSRSILVVVPRVPWPPRRSGFSVRYFPLLRYLSANHSVDLVVLGDRDAWGDANPFDKIGRTTFVDVSGRTPPLAARIATLARGFVPASAPYSIRSVWTGEVVRAVREAASARNYDALLWAGPEYFEAALMVASARLAPRCVFDLVDSPSMIATRARSQPHAERDVQQIRAWENRLRAAAHLTIYISDADSRASQPADARLRTATLPNGIYLDDLGDRSRELPRPAGLAPRYVLFFGHMSFGPNVDAAGWLANDIMPALRAREPGLELVIAGHQPEASVQALAGPQTIVTGSVDSIWPYVSNAAACIFPLRLAAGLQNKILEALALGKAVVTTRQCAAAIGAVSGEHLLTADTREEFIAASSRVLDDAALAQRLGAAGERLVRSAFDWNALTQRFEQAILGA